MKVKARVAAILAEDLGVPVTDEQALKISANNLAGVRSASGAQLADEFCVRVPLTEEERRIAEEISYHAWKALAAKGDRVRDRRTTLEH